MVRDEVDRGRAACGDNVDGRGHGGVSEGTVPKTRGRRRAHPPACPVVVTDRLGHGTGGQHSRGPLPHGATVSGLVPARRDCRSVGSSRRRAGAAGLAHASARSSGGRAVRGHLPAQGDVRAAASGALSPQSPPAHPYQG